MQDRPRRQAAIKAVHEAALANLTPKQRAARCSKVLAAEEKEAKEAVIERALEEETNLQEQRPPLTVNEWNAHVVMGECLHHV